jgi:Tol biopolymer transport system component
MEIVVRALAPGAREVAVTSDGMQNVHPAFSPDGRLLAYHSVVRAGIWVVPALGGVPRRLTSFGSRPGWSPDGTELVFQGQSWVGSTEGSFAAGEGSTLWVVPAAGGEPRRITSVEQTGPGGHGSAAWSPSAGLIAFAAGGKVFAVRPDGTGFRRTSGGPWITEVAWAGDGETQIWTGGLHFNWYVWRVRVDPDTGLPTGDPEVLATGGDKGAAWTHPVSSPDGKRVAYVNFRTRHELMVQRVTSGGLAVGEPVPLVRGIAGRKQPPMYSPDGRRFAFAVVRPGEGQALWVMDGEGSEPRLLVERKDIYATPLWFPDSRHLGFNTLDADGRTLWTVDVESGEIRRRGALPPQMGSAALSPDGRRLIGHGPRDGVLNLWTASVDGGEARPLTADREGLGWPVWSPDGTMLAVEMMRGGDTRVGVMPSAGGPLRELTTARGQSWPYSFSPDGRRVAFVGQRDGIWNVYWVPVEGGEERRVTSYTSPALYVRYCDWSPRGDRIAYEYAESSSSVWVTELAQAR